MPAKAISGYQQRSKVALKWGLGGGCHENGKEGTIERYWESRTRQGLEAARTWAPERKGPVGCSAVQTASPRRLGSQIRCGGGGVKKGQLCRKRHVVFIMLDSRDQQSVQEQMFSKEMEIWL